MTSGIIHRAKTGIAERVLGQALGLLGNNPDRNAKYVIQAIEHLANGENGAMISDWVRNWLSEGKPGRAFLGRVLKGTHPNVRRRYIARMVVNLFFRRQDVIQRCRERYGIYPPLAMVISPSMRCNYKCQGCYSASYERNDDMPPEVFDRLLTEAEDIGSRFFILVGGEPFIYKDLLTVLKKHDQAFFQIYTNGYFIDKDVARKLVELGNVAPMISVNGPEEFTDASRLKGAYSHVMRAMDNLREAGCIFGFSTLATRLNADVICEDAWMDLLIEKGALYGWLFLYMPVGDDPDMDLMPTPQQRENLRAMVMRTRQTKPILPIDFWNDGPLAGSCLAGGRHYFHINHRGDAEPCIFCHFATHNIHQSSIGEVLASPFFKAIRDEQPFAYNTLRPCPIIDHPEALWSIIETHGAKATHAGAEKMFTTFAPEMKRYADGVEEIMDDVWEREGYSNWAARWLNTCRVPRERIEARRQEHEAKRNSRALIG